MLVATVLTYYVIWDKNPDSWNTLIFCLGRLWYLRPGLIGLTTYPYKHGLSFFLEA
jgi:hypothetical protein